MDPPGARLSSTDSFSLDSTGGPSTGRAGNLTWANLCAVSNSIVRHPSRYFKNLQRLGVLSLWPDKAAGPGLFSRDQWHTGSPDMFHYLSQSHPLPFSHPGKPCLLTGIWPFGILPLSSYSGFPSALSQGLTAWSKWRVRNYQISMWNYRNLLKEWISRPRQEKRLTDEFEQINGEHLTMPTDLGCQFLLRPAMTLLQVAYAVILTFRPKLQSSGFTGLIYAFIQYVNQLFQPLIDVT